MTDDNHIKGLLGRSKDAIFTSEEAAAYLRISPGTLNKWCRAGKIEYLTTPGRHRRFRLADLDGVLLSNLPDTLTVTDSQGKTTLERQADGSYGGKAPSGETV